MKTIKVADATGRTLDYLVAKAMGHSVKLRTWKDITDTLDPVEDADLIAFHKERNTIRVSAEQIPGGGWFPCPSYSTEPSAAWPIIDREKISIQQETGQPAVAVPDRSKYPGCDAPWVFGHTALIAAMRCYVITKLGETVEIPEELS